MMPRIRNSDDYFKATGPMNRISRVFLDFANVPDFSEGLCRGQHELFDGTAYNTTSSGEWNSKDRESIVFAGTRHGFINRKEARVIAAAVCAECPVLRQCYSWVSGLEESERPAGIVAGQMWTRFGAANRRAKADKRKSKEEEEFDRPKTMIELIEQLG